MPTTRSASGLAPVPKESDSAIPGKRKAAELDSPSKSRSKPSSKKVRVAALEPPSPIPLDTASLVPNDTDTTPAVPAVLSFDFEEAKRHLIKADARFEDAFERMQCKPFEEFEQVHPFRALATSILGQQISWMAARSINHRFIRLYDPSIPESYAEYAETKSADSFFPSPQQVVQTDLASLRAVGLSGRKAEYIHDVAARFSDGRLSTKKLLEATDEELSEMLIQIYGVGKWTVDMFSIFSMRRPNILPVADLGVQRGLLRWTLALHSQDYAVTFTPDKLKSPEKETATPKSTTASKSKGKGKGKKGKKGTAVAEDTLPLFGGNAIPEGENADISTAPPASALVPEQDGADETASAVPEIPSMPPPFTPSINKTLSAITLKPGSEPPALPAGLTVATLKSRLDPKKKIKGAILTPKEMEDLTEAWKPYRSLGVYYMWALVEDK